MKIASTIVGSAFLAFAAQPAHAALVTYTATGDLQQLSDSGAYPERYRAALGVQNSNSFSFSMTVDTLSSANCMGAGCFDVKSFEYRVNGTTFSSDALDGSAARFVVEFSGDGFKVVAFRFDRRGNFINAIDGDEVFSAGAVFQLPSRPNEVATPPLNTTFVNDATYSFAFATLASTLDFFPDGGGVTLDGGFRPQITVSASVVDAVPEPTTWAMLLIGFGMIGASSRYRRRSTRSSFA